jgi:hypothetical protein
MAVMKNEVASLLARMGGIAALLAKLLCGAVV